MSLESVLLIALIAIFLAIAAIVFQKNNTKDDKSQKSATDLIKTDIVELSRTINELQKTVTSQLDKSSMSMQASVQRQLSESSKLVADVSKRLVRLDETNKRVVDVASELKSLQNVLSNPKQRGVFGEFYLQSVLENVLPVGQYSLQHKFKDGQIVDAVIFLEKGKMLPIDSKFSLENYNRMIESSGEARKVLMAKVKQDLKGRIDETSKYIRPGENTMDFAFMFIPSESLYYDLLISNVGQAGGSRDLIEYAFRDKRVIIVSPTSFMAYLQTVLQGLRSLQIEEQAKAIQDRVGKLGKHISTFDVYMNKLGSSLSTTVNHFNAAHKELGKVDKDIIKITDRNSNVESIEPSTVDKPVVD